MADIPVRRRRWVVAGLCLVVLVPMVLAVVVVVRTSWWRPGGDEALISLHGWEAGSPAAALGPYSRYGWNHPGPALFWALALPARLLFDAGRGAAVGAVLVNALSAVVAVWLVARRAGTVAAAGMVGLLCLLAVTDPGGVWSVWNPYVTLLPFLACVVALWGVAEGEVPAVPVVALTGLFCIESHVGYASVLVAMGLVAGVLAVVGWWRKGRPVPGPRAAVALGATTVGSVVLAWPVVADQVAGTGNLVKIVEYFAGSGRATTGMEEALGQVGRQLAPWGPWVGGREPVSIFGGSALPAPTWWILVPVAAVVAAVGAAWWRHDTTMLRLLAIVVSGMVAGVWAVSSITPPAYPYLFVWLHVLAALMWGAVLLTFVRAALRGRDRVPAADGTDRRRRAGAVGAVVVLAVVPVTIAAVRLARSELPEVEGARAAQTLVPAALAAVPEGATFAISSDVPYTRVVESIGAELIEQGRILVVDADHALGWGTERVGDVNDPSVVRLVILVGPGGEQAPTPEGWRSLARWAPERLDPSGAGMALNLVVLTARTTAEAPVP